MPTLSRLARITNAGNGGSWGMGLMEQPGVTTPKPASGGVLGQPGFMANSASGTNAGIMPVQPMTGGAEPMPGGFSSMMPIGNNRPRAASGMGAPVNYMGVGGARPPRPTPNVNYGASAMNIGQRQLGDAYLLNPDGTPDYAGMASPDYFNNLTPEQRQAYTSAGMGRMFSAMGNGMGDAARGAANPALGEQFAQRATMQANNQAAFGGSGPNAMQDWVTNTVANMSGEQITQMIDQLMQQSGTYSGGPVPAGGPELVAYQQAQALMNGARLGWFNQPVNTYGYGSYQGATNNYVGGPQGPVVPLGNAGPRS